MLKFLKNFGLGLLYILLFPFLLVGVAVFAIYGFFRSILQLFAIVGRFFKGEKIFPPYPEDVKAQEILAKNYGLEEKEETPAPQPAQNNVYVQQNYYPNPNNQPPYPYQNNPGIAQQPYQQMPPQMGMEQPQYQQVPPMGQPQYQQVPPMGQPQYQQVPPMGQPQYQQVPPASQPQYQQGPQQNPYLDQEASPSIPAEENPYRTKINMRPIEEKPAPEQMQDAEENDDPFSISDFMKGGEDNE